MTHHRPEDVATAFIGQRIDALDARAQRVAQHIAERRHIARDPAKLPEPAASRGQRAADAVTAFGGSWTFVGLFAAVMVCWIGVNVVLLWRIGSTFDPYPFILLNLFLSMLAAVQAPVILMSQNRQAEKDRATAGHDYEVNLKAELEIMLLHDKLDRLSQEQWAELLDIQREQTLLLQRLVESPAPPP